MNPFHFLLLVCAIFALVVPLVFILCAKPGHEDATGYHADRPSSVIRVEGDTAHVCAWCDGDNAGTQWADDNGLIASHGICPICHAQMFPEFSENN